MPCAVCQGSKLGSGASAVFSSRLWSDTRPVVDKGANALARPKGCTTAMRRTAAVSDRSSAPSPAGASATAVLAPWPSADLESRWSGLPQSAPMTRDQGTRIGLLKLHVRRERALQIGLQYTHTHTHPPPHPALQVGRRTPGRQVLHSRRWKSVVWPLTVVGGVYRPVQCARDLVACAAR